MRFTSESATDGVLERTFDLEVAGERVPGVVWSPSGATGGRPLVLMGHGGGQHKQFAGIVARARDYVTALGFAVAAIDAPGHGERVPSDQVSEFVAEIRELATSGKPLGTVVARENARQAAIAVPEWRATLDVLQTIDSIGAHGPVGYWGISMGGAIGVALVAEEPRITAAVLGLVGLVPEGEALADAAAGISVPVEFVLQWDDEVISRDSGIALYDALGSAEKSLHVNLGRHVQIPSFESESWQRFFARHLLRAG